MIPTRYLVDTNVLLRFLTGTPADHAAASRKLFQQAAAGEVVLEVASVTVAEAHYTLISFYGIDRKLASEKLGLLLRQHGVDLREENQVLGALARLQTIDVGFADAYLAAGASEANVAIASFDRDFDRMKVARYEARA